MELELGTSPADEATFGALYPRHAREWMPDDASPRCMACEAFFGRFTRRRHHCRMCGRLFCDSCTCERRRVPEVLRLRLPQPPSAGTSQQRVRVCRACASHVDVHADAELWVERCRTNHFLTIREWRTLTCCSSVLKKAMRILLTVWRRVPYILPWNDLNDDERGMLQANRHLLSGHARVTMLAMSAGFPVPRRHGRVPCACLGCFRYCTPHLRVGDSIEILSRLPFDVSARALAMDGLLRDIKGLKPYVGALLDIGARDPSLVHVVLTKLVAHSPHMAHHVLWRCFGAAHAGIATCLLSSLPEHVRCEVQASRSWAAALEEVVNGTTAAVPPPRAAHLPGCRDVFVLRILTEQRYTITDSASRPTVVPVLVEWRGERSVQHVLYKPGVVLNKDCAVMDATQMLQGAFALETGQDVPAVRYHVVQLKHGGLVLMVPGTRSLASIRSTGVSLLNFLIDNNPSVRSGVLRDTFVRSCAFSSTLALLLGIGDRHLENILVRVATPEGGILFHIDFDFLLNDEPSHLASRAAVPRLRITSSIEDALGGSQSHDFAVFKTTCGEFMSVAARWARELFYILLGNEVGRESDIEAHLRSWIASGGGDDTTTTDVNLRIEQVVRASTRFRTIDSLFDRLHAVSKGWW